MKSCNFENSLILLKIFDNLIINNPCLIWKLKIVLIRTISLFWNINIGDVIKTQKYLNDKKRNNKIIEAKGKSEIKSKNYMKIENNGIKNKYESTKIELNMKWK